MDVPMPPAFAARVAGQDAADRRQAENDAYAAADEAELRRRVAEHQAHVFEAQTGYSEAEWFHAQQQIAWAKGDAGYDPAATPGTAAHPEVLIDGASLPRPAAPGTARRSEPTDDALARRVDEEREAGQAMLMRHRTAVRQREIRRLELELELERGQAHGAATAASSGRVVVRSSAAGDRLRSPTGPVLSRPELASRLTQDW